MLIHDLQNLGFTKNQASVYLALIGLQQATAGELIKKTSLHRQLVYSALENLEERKLISKTEHRGRLLFRGLSPDRIVEDLQNKTNLANNIVEELRLNFKPPNQEIIVYEGVEDLRRKELEVYETLPENSSFCYLGNATAWYIVMGDKLTTHLANLQKKKSLYIRALATRQHPEHDVFLNNGNLTKIRYLPNMASAPVSETQILSDRVLLKTFIAPYSMVEIINTELAKNYLDYFNSLWGK